MQTQNIAVLNLSKDCVLQIIPEELLVHCFESLNFSFF